jgi:hypothetical protein
MCDKRLEVRDGVRVSRYQRGAFNKGLQYHPVQCRLAHTHSLAHEETFHCHMLNELHVQADTRTFLDTEQ